MDKQISVKRSRTGLYVLLGIFTIFLGSVLGMYAYFNEARLRGLLVPVLESATNRRVNLARVGLGLWGGVEASVEGLSISDRQGFGDSDFISASRASFSMDFWPLLSGEARFGEVLIENPSISIVINTQGEANYSDLQDESPGSNTGSGSGGEFVVQSMKIRNGTLRYHDRQQGTLSAVEGIDYDVQWGLRESKIALDGHLSVGRLVYESEGEGTNLNGIDLNHSLLMDIDNGSLKVELVDVGAGGIRMKIRGWVRQEGAATQCLMEIEEQAFDLKELTGQLMQSGLLPDQIRLEGRVRVAAKLEGAWNPNHKPAKVPSLSGSLFLDGVMVETPDLLVPVKDLFAEIKMGDGVLKINRFSASAGRSDFSIAGKVSGLMAEMIQPQNTSARPLMEVSVKSTVMDLDELIPIENQAALESTSWSFTTPALAVPQALPVPSPLPHLLRGLDVDGALDFKELKSDGTVVENLTAKLKSRRAVMMVNHIAAAVYGGSLSGQVELDARDAGKPYPVAAEFSVEGAKATSLLKEFLGWSIPLQGELGVDIGFNGAVDSALELVYSNLSALGKAGMEQGKLVNWGVLKQAASQVSQLGFMNFDEIPIRNLIAPFKIENGRLVFSNAKFRAADLDCRLSGSTGIDKLLDYTLDVDLPASRLNVGGLNLGNALGAFVGGGSIPLRLKIAGTIDGPKVSASLRSAPQTEKGNGGQKGKGGLEKKAKGLLKKFF